MKFTIKGLKAEYEPYHTRKNEPYKGSNKLYIWPENETVLDNLFNRHDRPSKVWKTEVIPVVIEKLKEEFPNVYEAVKNEEWGWRQKCGCTCPCSPGFIGKQGGQYYISATVEFVNE
jgi:hypothetical protein